MKPFEISLIDDVKYILVPEERWDKLHERDTLLYYLEVAGVDNWEGYGYALEMRDEEDSDN